MWRKSRSKTGGRNQFGDVSVGVLECWNFIMLECYKLLIIFLSPRSVRVLTSTGTLATTGEDPGPVMILAAISSEDLVPSLSPSLRPSRTSY